MQVAPTYDLLSQGELLVQFLQSLLDSYLFFNSVYAVVAISYVRCSVLGALTKLDALRAVNHYIVSFTWVSML